MTFITTKKHTWRVLHIKFLLSLTVTYIFSFSVISAQAQMFNPNDVDGDSFVNGADVDSDNDGIADAIECTVRAFNKPIATEQFESATFITDAGLNNPSCAMSGCALEPRGGGVNIGDSSALACWQPTTGVVSGTKDAHTLPSGNAAIFNAFSTSFPPGDVNNCFALADHNSNNRIGEIAVLPNVSVNANARYSVALYLAELTNTDPASGNYRIRFYEAGTNTQAGIPDVTITNLTNGDQSWQLNEATFTAPLTQVLDVVFIQTAGQEFGADIAIDSFSVFQEVCTLDSDNDGITNDLDLDSDNDGIPDNIEAQTTAGYRVPQNADTDNDGLDNAYDTDNGGVALTPVNTDSVDTPDFLDSDSDNDGLLDRQEIGFTNTPSTFDDDQDGLLNTFENGTTNDNFIVNDGITNPSTFLTNTDPSSDVDYRSQLDTDGDGIANINDTDKDNDGITDSTEGYIPSQEITTLTQVAFSDSLNNNGAGTVSGLLLDVTSCDSAFTANFDFISTGGDIPNLISDGSGVTNNLNISYQNNLSGTSQLIYSFSEPVNVRLALRSNNPNESVTFLTPYDRIIPGVGSTIVSSTPLVVWHNNNASTIDEETFFEFDDVSIIKLGVEGNNLSQRQRIFISGYRAGGICVDTDSDSYFDHLDLDSDNDGIPDNIEAQTTAGYRVPQNADTDNDGLDNAYDTDNGGMALAPVNTDNADAPDYLDTNSDNDSGTDQLETGVVAATNSDDTDGDGLLDAYENGSINDGFIVNDGITSPLTRYPDIDNANDIDTREINPPAITINPVTDDDIINITEANGDISVTGTTTNVQDGQLVSVVINGVTYQGSVSNNSWVVVIPSSDAQSLSAANTLTANVANTIGDNAPQATRDVERVLAAPLIGINVVAQDDIINQTEGENPLTIQGTTSNVADGRQVSVGLGGQVYTAPVSSGTWLVTVPVEAVQALTSAEFIRANVTTAAGDNAPEASRTVVRSGPEPSVAISAIAGDDNISAAEDDSSVDISGTTQGVENGQILTLTVNDQTFTATVQNNAWSVAVPASSVQAFDAQELVAVQVANAAQDTANAERIVNYAVTDPSTDSDNDGIPDVIEGNEDIDGDGLPNALDPDSDNDGIDDAIEAGVTGNDADNDGIDDAFDASTLGGEDQDGDGIIDNAPTPDTDNDGTPDFLDTDSDNDTVPDRLESGGANTPVDTDQDGIPDYRDLDSDGDRIADVVEVGENPLMPIDTDNDGIPDGLDIDSDGDNIIDTFESVNIPAPLNADMNGNGIDDSIDVVFTMGVDVDNNGIDDLFDPLDTDADNIPDYLDTDSDGDGINDNIENDVLVMPVAIDTNGNGLVDTIDVLITGGSDTNQNGIDDDVEPNDTDADGMPDFQDTDSDNDTLPDEDEGSIDTDGDGNANYRDTDSDNDTLTDTQEAGENTAQPRDTDGDGTVDYLDVDSDNDGLLDSVEAINAVNSGNDSDADGVPDYLDLDADNDGLLDADEIAAVAGMDTDSDMIIDRFDADADNDGQVDMGKTDADNDGIDDAVDANVNGVITADINNDGIQDTANVFDSDGDGVPNVLDLDSDNDGLTDVDESSGLGRDENEDGRLDGNDFNGNGVIDSVDTTLGETAVVSPDTDQDNLPDFLDLDSDGDGLSDLSEAGLLTRDPDANGQIGTVIFVDSNGNGLSDLVEPQAGGQRPLFTDSDFDGTPDTLSLDSDGDGNTDLAETVGDLVAEQLDPDGDGKLGDQTQVPVDNNRNGIADSSEDINSEINVRARADSNSDGVSDVIEGYLDSIRVLTPAQPVDPVTGVVNLPDADFDRDGYPDVIEVRFGGNPLQSAEQDSDGDGIPDWVEQTDTNGDGNNDSDNDGFSDLLEQIIGTNSEVSESQDVLFNAAQNSILNMTRYDGRSNQPVIWVDTMQAGRSTLNVQSAPDTAATFTARIGNYRVFGDPRDTATTPVYSWSSTNTILAEVVAGVDAASATLTLDTSMLPVGFYPLTLSVTLGGHTSTTDHVFEVIDGVAALDNDRDRQPNDQDSRSANAGFLHDIESSFGFYFMASSPLVINQDAFNDRAIRLRQGQFTQVQPSLAVTLSLDELRAAVSTQNPEINNVEDSAFSHDVIYDYDVINLPFVGASARVVIPLAEPIRRNATLRQYSVQQGWQPMMFDNEQDVLSAPWLPDTELFDDQVGVCPDPERDIDLYTPGLTQGHQCVALTVQDGSANDTENNGEQTEDGQGDVNGLIKNTVSLAVAASEVRGGRIETGLDGGGSVSQYTLIALYILLLLALYRTTLFTLNLNRK